MRLPRLKSREHVAVEEVEPPEDLLRTSVIDHLVVCEAVRNGFFDVGLIGVDPKTGIALTSVTLEDVDQTEAIIRDFYNNRYPDLIGRYILSSGSFTICTT